MSEIIVIGNPTKLTTTGGSPLDSRPDIPPHPHPEDPTQDAGVALHNIRKAIESARPPRLSVLLPTVINRAALFAKLHAEIQRQCEGRAVEILVACDAKEISIGKKRQNLLEQATGDYIAFIDDDDWIAETYVDRILAALATSPDCVGFLISCTTNGGKPVMAKASMRYRQWGEGVDGYAHTRSPYHKTPHLRSIALQVGFPDLRFGEDRPFSAGITKLIKTEVFVNAVLYHYRFKTESFHQKYGIKVPPKQPRSPRTVTGERIPRLDYKGRRVGWL